MKRWVTSKGGVKYEMNALEQERFDEFQKQCYPHPVKLIIENNPIGWVAMVHCPSLKIEKNITDYSTW